MPDMAKMMEGMGKTPQKEIFPSMMAVPEASAETRAALETRARERLNSGMELISSGVDQLSREVGGSNYAAMQEATAKMREGLARFDSGIMALRAMGEGVAYYDEAADDPLRDPSRIRKLSKRGEHNARRSTGA